MKNQKFVLSSHAFETIAESERKVTSWMMAGQFDQKCRLYKIIEEYRPAIKFVKVKKHL
jgi:hypothetical protein